MGMDEMIELLKEKSYQIPQTLLFRYKELKLTDQDFILILYLWNSMDSSYNPKKISNDLGIPLKDVLELINSLSERGFLTLNIVKINNVRNECISLDLLYEKLAFLLLKKEKGKKEDTTLFDVCEKELGRQLAPTEIGIIRGWLETVSEETIILALKEAIYNGVTNFRYIDRILSEWSKKGIQTKEDVERNRKAFTKKKKATLENPELEGYDWLNDDREDS